MVLTIYGHKFPLPDKCKFSYDGKRASVHIIFEEKESYEYLISQICEKLMIKRYDHDLGIVFGDQQIFFRCENPPKCVFID